MVSPKLRYLIIFAVFALASISSRAQATTPTCEPFDSCPSVYCEADGVFYAADCKQVHADGIAGPYQRCEQEADSAGYSSRVCSSEEVGGIPKGVQALGVLALLGVFWVLPGVLVYRAAKARGLDAGAVLGSWLFFGWLGVSYHLFKAVPRQDQLDQVDRGNSPTPDYTDLSGGMHRAAQRIADNKARKRSR